MARITSWWVLIASRDGKGTAMGRLWMFNPGCATDPCCGTATPRNCGLKSYAFSSACVVPHGPVAGVVAIQDADAGVASRNAIQNVFLRSVAGGTFTLTFDGETTASIAYSATPTTMAANIVAALEALPNIPAGGVFVSTTSRYNVTFQGGLAGVAVPLMTIDGSALTGSGTARTPLPGLGVTLRKAGVLVSQGVTDAAGLVALAIFEDGADYTVELSGIVLDDYYDNSPYTRTLACGTLQVEGWMLYPRWVTLADPIQNPIPGPNINQVTYTGDNGSAVGFSVTVNYVDGNSESIVIPGLNVEASETSHTYSWMSTYTDATVAQCGGFSQSFFCDNQNWTGGFWSGAC